MEKSGKVEDKKDMPNLKKKTYLHFLKKQEMRDTSGPSVALSAVH